MVDEASEAEAEQDDDQTPEGSKARGTRPVRPFPAASFEEALTIGLAIQRLSSGSPIRRLTLFHQLGKAPESGTSRQMITNSGKYGLTVGGYRAEMIELTAAGAIATNDEAPPRERARQRANLAIMAIDVFKALYDRFVGNKLPTKAVLVDAAKEQGLSDDFAEEAVDLFIVNLEFVGLLQTLSGAERIITLDHLLDTLPSAKEAGVNDNIAPRPEIAVGLNPTDDFAKICFYITPIGEEDSEVRQHSDLFLGSIVEPALERFGLKVVRADKIDKPGTITRQILEYIVKSKLVIADLSFHNPNVFYELAIRHAMRLPTVQIIRKHERVPFDVSQARTIVIDTTTIYSLVPKLETYKSEIASQVRRALEDPDASDNPIAAFFPGLRVGTEK